MVINDFGYKATPNLLFRNEYPEPYFEDVSKQTNMNLGINGMGVANGDINNDGLLDYFFTNIRTNQFLLSQGNGKPFVNRFNDIGTFYPFSTDSIGNRWIAVSWGCNLADFDNDQDLDLFVACGSLNPNVEPNPDCYFENLNGQFVNKALEKGLYNPGMGRGSLVFDYDNDGDPDLLVIGQKPVYKFNDTVDKYSFTQLFRNDIDSNRNWLKVSLHGIGSDTRGIGSRVVVVANGQKFIREIDGGSSHLSQNSTVAHFGLGSLTKVDSVIVTWMGGTRQVLTSINANQQITITEVQMKKNRDINTILVAALSICAILALGFWYRSGKRQG